MNVDDRRSGWLPRVEAAAWGTGVARVGSGGDCCR